MEELRKAPEPANTPEPGSTVKLIKRVYRKSQTYHSAEDKIRIVLEGFRNETPKTDLCRREKIQPSVYYSWLKTFMEGGKARLKGETLRGATEDEVEKYKKDNDDLKRLAGELMLELSLLKKSVL
ncbi:MAG: transposase [Elusimicrobiota bacterium]